MNTPSEMQLRKLAVTSREHSGLQMQIFNWSLRQLLDRSSNPEASKRKSKFEDYARKIGDWMDD
jgi:hypothetical protein